MKVKYNGPAKCLLIGDRYAVPGETLDVDAATARVYEGMLVPVPEEKPARRQRSNTEAAAEADGSEE